MNKIIFCIIINTFLCVYFCEAKKHTHASFIVNKNDFEKIHSLEIDEFINTVHDKFSHNNLVRMARRQGLDDHTREVLLNFGCVVSNFFNILQDTQNVPHVALCIKNMVSSMINIGVATVVNKSIALTADPNVQQIEIITALIQKIMHIIKDVNYKKRSHIFSFNQSHKG